MHNLVIMADVSALQVKMGIGFGTCALLYVGGVFQRQEFFTVGAALTFALDSETQRVRLPQADKLLCRSRRFNGSESFMKLER